MTSETNTPADTVFDQEIFQSLLTSRRKAISFWPNDSHKTGAQEVHTRVSTMTSFAQMKGLITEWEKPNTTLSHAALVERSAAAEEVRNIVRLQKEEELKARATRPKFDNAEISITSQRFLKVVR